jgi:hypothetical protein
MSTHPEETAKVSSDKETTDSSSTPGEVSVTTVNSNVAELPAIIKTSEVSTNVNSPETATSVGKSQSKTAPEGLQGNEKIKSSTQKGLKVFPTNRNSASNSDAIASQETVEETELSDCTPKGNKVTTGTADSKQAAAPTGVMVFTNNAFEPEVSQKEDNIQVGLIMEQLGKLQQTEPPQFV